MELPIACSLDTQGADQRRGEWQLLIRDALLSQTATSTGVRFVFSATDEFGRRLEELVKSERQCCAFACWTVVSEGHELVLRVAAEGEGAAAAIQELFRLPERSLDTDPQRTVWRPDRVAR